MASKLYSSLNNSDINRVKDKKTSNLVFTYLLANILMIIGLLFYVQQHVQILRFGYTQESLKKNHLDLLRKNEELRLEKASLESLSRIERIARKKFKMIEPGINQIIYVIE